jgi:Fe2+ transport system protein FeoA
MLLFSLCLTVYICNFRFNIDLLMWGVEVVRLSDVKSSTIVVIKRVRRDDYRFTFYNMGLYPGSSARVVYSDGVSVMVLDVRGSLVALSMSLAGDVDVDVVEGG